MPPRPRRRITSAKREEIEKEQQKLSSTIVRPFDILSGLPVSFNAPPNGHYDDVLKTPLTVKDTGVFYRSLIKSRYNYVHLCPMFCLYWVKQSSYAKKLAEENKPVPKSQREESLGDRIPVLDLDVSARDVMVKLCDAGLSLGPHQFEIRLFILKDGRPEKLSKKEMKELEVRKRQELDEARRIDLQKEKPVTGHDVSVNEPTKGDIVNEPVKSAEVNETVIVVGNKSDDPKAEAAKSDKNPEENSNPIQFEEKIEMLDEDKKEEQVKEGKENNKTRGYKEDNEYSEDEQDKDDKDDKDEESESEEEDVTNVSIVEDKPETEEVNIDEKPDSDDSGIDIEEKDKAISNSSSESKSETTSAQKYVSPAVSLSADSSSPVQRSSVVPASSTIPVASSSSPLSAQAPVSVGSPTATTRPPPPLVPPRSDPNNMQSIENTIMISNLNTIARTDESLNGLMKIVASGNASPQQIVTFQGYIKRAREMGPQPHHAYLFQPGAYSPYTNIKPKKIIKPPKEKKLPKEKKFPKEKKEKKPKLPKDQKLTAFQERYLENATLLFEFVENANVRFQLPKNAIIEVLPPSTMTNADGEDNSDNKDLLFSYIWIHNQDEVSDYDKKIKEYYIKVKERDEAEKKKIEEEKKRVEEEAKAKVETKAKEEEELEEEDQAKEDTEINGDVNKSDPVVEHNLRRRPARKAASVSTAPPPKSAPKGKAKKGKAKKKEVIVKLEKPEEPEIRFTTVSFIIHGIPLRFVPILTSSVNPLEKVQEYMEHILKVGTRMTNFFLWYQVDGKLDEALAEEVRNQLNQEEKKMPGITAASPSEKTATKETVGPKKRKLKEKNLDGRKKVKSTNVEVKKEHVSGANPAIIELVEPIQIETQSQKTEIEQNKQEEQEQQQSKHSSPAPEPVAVSTEIHA